MCATPVSLPAAAEFVLDIKKATPPAPLGIKRSVPPASEFQKSQATPPAPLGLITQVKRDVEQARARGHGRGGWAPDHAALGGRGGRHPGVQHDRAQRHDPHAVGWHARGRADGRHAAAAGPGAGRLLDDDGQATARGREPQADREGREVPRAGGHHAQASARGRGRGRRRRGHRSALPIDARGRGWPGRHCAGGDALRDRGRRPREVRLQGAAEARPQQVEQEGVREDGPRRRHRPGQGHAQGGACSTLF